MTQFEKKIDLGDGFYRVRGKDYLWGVYDESRKRIIIPCLYEGIMYSKYNGLFILKKKIASDNNVFVVNCNNETVIPLKYNDISILDQKYLLISETTFISKRKNGIVSADGKLIVQPKYGIIWASESGKFIVTDGCRCGIVKENGLSDLEYDSYEKVLENGSSWDSRLLEYNGSVRRFSSVFNDETILESKPKYLIVSKFNKYGVINLDNKLVLPLKFDEISVEYDLDDDDNYVLFFLVKKDGYYGYYGEQGDVIIPLSYTKDAAEQLFNNYIESLLLSQLKKSLLSNSESTIIKEKNKGKLAEKPFQSIKPSNSVYNEEDFYLFFDTETTGLPVDYNAPSSNLSNWPRMVQLSWILTDGSGKELRTCDYIIKPKGFTIPVTASRLNGITTERANKEGFDLEIVLSLFLADLNLSKVIVGHNIDFDKKIVGAELIRAGKEDVITSKKSICTMKESVTFCKLPGRYGFKYPTLQDLHFKLFGCSFDGAHDSANDVSATVKCFWKMKSLGIL